MTAANHAGQMVAPLLLELKNSEQIILAMLNAMTLAQKSKVHAKLGAAGVSGEGMTRHHERRAVIAAAEAALGQATALETASSETAAEQSLVRRPPRTMLVESEAPPPDLTPAELNLIRSFRAMNDSSQTFIGRLSDNLAEKTPRRVTPTLRLIAGGAA